MNAPITMLMVCPGARTETLPGFGQNGGRQGPVALHIAVFCQHRQIIRGQKVSRPEQQGDVPGSAPGAGSRLCKGVVPIIRLGGGGRDGPVAGQDVGEGGGSVVVAP